MKLLLDTHLLLWALLDDPRLSALARRYIGSAGNQLYFSAASVWEVTLKGEARIGISGMAMRQALLDAGYEELPITGDQVRFLTALPDLHKDPFDRIMLAQAMAEGMLLLTHDTLLANYGAPAVQV